MFKDVMAIRKGQKLAQSIGIHVRDIINYLINSDCDIGIRDTGFVLLETNALFSFCYLIKIDLKTDLEFGIISEIAKESLHDWLKKIWSLDLTVEQANEYSDKVIGDIKPHLIQWTKEFRTAHTEMIGKHLQEIIPIAIQKYMDDIAAIFIETNCNYEQDKIYDMTKNNLGRLLDIK